MRITLRPEEAETLYILCQSEIDLIDKRSGMYEMKEWVDLAKTDQITKTRCKEVSKKLRASVEGEEKVNVGNQVND